MKKFYAVLLSVLLASMANAQEITITRIGDCDWTCESPRSGRQLSCNQRQDKAIQACVNESFSNGEDYVVRGGDYNVSTSGNTSPPSPPPDPTEPPPDPDPTDPPPSNEELPAYTFNIEGFGRKTRGAHDCPTGDAKVVHVTSLDNDRDLPGTLMNAVRQDCAYIIFDVAGDIDMTNALPSWPGYDANGKALDSGGYNTWRVTGAFLTIDGRTAPAPGITLINVDRVSIECRGAPSVCQDENSDRAHDIIVSNIRTVSAYGPGTNPNELITKGHWIIDGSEGDVRNIVLDHLTMINSGQGNVNIYNKVRDVTLQHSFSDGSLVGHHISGAGFVREHISIFKHVYAHHNERQVRLRYDNPLIDIVGNVIYGWGWYEGGAHGLDFAAASSNFISSGNVENNIYHFVGAAPFGRARDALVNDYEGPLPGPWYFANNRWPVGEETGDAEATSETRIDLGGYELPREFASRADILNAGTHFKTTYERDLLQEIAEAVH